MASQKAQGTESDSDYGPSMQSAQEAIGLLFFALFGGGGVFIGYTLSGSAGVGTAVLMSVVGLIIGSILAVTLYLSIIINLEYERAVVYRLGRFARVISPGLTYKLPYFEWAEKVDTRVTTENVNPQNVMTADSVPVTVDAIVYYRVRKEKDAVRKALIEADDYHEVTKRYAQTKLRNLIGESNLDEILHNRKQLAERLETELDDATNDFGVKVRDVELQDIEIPDDMERSMAAEAEAERDRRAKVRRAQGEVEAAVGMRSASEILGRDGLKLRTLETLDSVAVENSTIIPIPIGMNGFGGAEESEEELPDEIQQLINNKIDSIDGLDLAASTEEIVNGDFDAEDIDVDELEADEDIE